MTGYYNPVRGTERVLAIVFNISGQYSVLIVLGHSNKYLYFNQIK